MKNRIKKSLSQTPPAKPVTHTGALHSTVGFPGYSLNKIVRKGRATVLVLFFLALTACNHKKHVNQPAKQATKPVLVVHVNDYTASVSRISYFDSTNAKELYYAVAKFSGTIKHIGIYAESREQNIVTLNIEKLDTIGQEEGSNVYLAAKKKAKNQRIVDEFRRKTQRGITGYVQRTSAPATETHTDLADAFDLVSVAINQPNYSGYTRYLLVTSDLKDCPKKGQPHLEPLNLDNTQILLVRPQLPQSEINRLFPSSLVFTTTSDAINYIFSNNQN